MIATGKRNIRGGHEFDRFFTNRPIGNFVIVKKEATLDDTLALMKKVVIDTLDDTKEIAQRLQGASVKQTCNRIWNFCFSHFQYEKDEERKEQVRRPSRSWKDRIKGIDCDCLTVLIGSILTNLGIAFKMRMTRYEALDFEHIYPVAVTPEGEVIIDCVVHQFNYEVPYTQKKDVEMELQYLNGVKQERFNELGEKVEFENDLPIDAEDLFLDEMELQGLEGKAERQARKAKRKGKRKTKKADRKAKNAEIKKLPKKERLKARLQQGLHAINRLNPGAALLRAGILLSMKLNILKVASHLRFAYWTEEQARKNSMDLSKFNQLQRIREKMEKIFFGAGGKPKNLKKAILKGKGNKNSMVQLNGLGQIISNINDEDDLRTILGDELFFDEELSEIETIDGLGGLGVVASSAAVGAASSVIGIIAKLIKKLGGLFKKGSKEEGEFKDQDESDDVEEKTRKFSLKNIKKNIQERRLRKKANKEGGDTDSDTSAEDEFVFDENSLKTLTRELDAGTDVDTTETTDPDVDADADDKDDGKDKKGFGQWVKDNKVLAGLIGAGIAIGGTALTVHLVKKSKKKKKKKGLDGTPKKEHKKFVPKSRGKKKPTTKNKTANRVPKVELL